MESAAEAERRSSAARRVCGRAAEQMRIGIGQRIFAGRHAQCCMHWSSQAVRSRRT